MSNNGNHESDAHLTEHTQDARDGANIVDLVAYAQERSRQRHPSMATQSHPAQRLTDHSPDALWRADFEVHAGQHTNLTTSGMWVLAPVVERALRMTLPVLQLGASGAGFHLMNSARNVASDDLRAALKLFVIEQQEHARLLALVCSELDITMLDDHWTDRAFRSVRRMRGLRLEMLLVVLAELITTQLYAALAVGVGDPVLSRLFARMHADGLRHLEFHAAVLPHHLHRLHPVRRAMTRTPWRVAARVATIAVAIEHRQTLRAVGTGPVQFVRDTFAILAGQEDRFLPAA